MEAIQLAVFCETRPSEQQADVQGGLSEKPRQLGIVLAKTSNRFTLPINCRIIRQDVLEGSVFKNCLMMRTDLVKQELKLTSAP